jgi:hypothetical protein
MSASVVTVLFTTSYVDNVLHTVLLLLLLYRLER